MSIFAQKKAVVIGGSGGIGAKLSLKLAQEGASVMVHGGHNSQKLTDLMETLETNSPQPAHHQSLVQEITGDNLAAFPTSPLMEHVKEADILCVAFGPFLQGSLEDTTPQQWMDITLLNYALPGICFDCGGLFLRPGGPVQDRRRILVAEQYHRPLPADRCPGLPVDLAADGAAAQHGQCHVAVVAHGRCPVLRLVPGDSDEPLGAGVDPGIFVDAGTYRSGGVLRRLRLRLDPGGRPADGRW